MTDQAAPRPALSLQDNSRRAEILVAVGAPESGKSTAVNFKLDADAGPRRLIWDPGEDYTRHGSVFSSVESVRRHLLAAGSGPFRVVFRPPDELERAGRMFDVLCRFAFAVGNVLVTADELEDVVLPNWAPPGWSMLVRKGRKRGVRIVAASQRPAGLEKRVWSFATVVRSGRLNDADDARTVSRALMVEPVEVLSLAPLQWIQRDMVRGRILRGHIEWRAGRAVDVLDGVTELTAAPPGPSPTVTRSGRAVTDPSRPTAAGSQRPAMVTDQAPGVPARSRPGQQKKSARSGSLP